ncbi:hypothetical protein BM1_00065 [Bipolaris maydis]|nr:hypothetical protein BM1_00065 [Bipolaris maydis]
MMYPFCKDARRLELINVLMIMLWVYNDKCEKSTGEEAANLLHEWEVRLGTGDRGCSTAGRELHLATLNTEYWLKPPAKYENLGEYLAYRYRNIGAVFVWSCVKFSMDLKVDISDPRIAEWLEWAGLHLGMIPYLHLFTSAVTEELIDR